MDINHTERWGSFPAHLNLHHAEGGEEDSWLGPDAHGTFIQCCPLTSAPETSYENVPEYTSSIFFLLIEVIATQFSRTGMKTEIQTKKKVLDFLFLLLINLFFFFFFFFFYSGFYFVFLINKLLHRMRNSADVPSVSVWLFFLFILLHYLFADFSEQ